MDDYDNIEEILAEPSRRIGQRRTTSRPNRTTSQSNVRSNHSSRRSSHRTASSHRVKHEDSSETESSASDDLGATTDEEQQPSRPNRTTYNKVSFFC